MAEENPVEQNVQRVTKLMKAAVQLLGVSHRQIERTMGLSTGYLSRILSGKVELRVEHVLGICAAINLPPGAFFEAAFPVRDHDLETARLVAALRELMPESEDAARPVPRSVSAADRAQKRSAARARMASRILELVLTNMDKESPGWEDDLS